MTNRSFFLFLSLFCASAFSVEAQGRYKPKETYNFTINNSTSTVKFGVMAGKETFHAHPELTYYWYSTNKILETKGGYDGKLLSGQYAVFYMNNNLKEKGKFSKGLKEGEWMTWYDNGKIMEIVNWKRGLRNGLYQSFNEIGQPVLEANYRKGKLDGKSTTYLKGSVSDVHYYSADKELEPKHKKKDAQVSDKALKTEEAKTEKHKTLKERWQGMFKKKNKEVKPAAKAAEPKKRNWFQKLKDKFKKKDSGKTSGAKP